MSSIDTTNYNALAGGSLTRGPIAPTNTPIGAGATATKDIWCGGDSELVVEVDMTGAATGDLVVEVRPFQMDNVTVQQNQVPVISSDGPDLVTGHVLFYGRYDVDGVEKVQLAVKNNNAGAQTLSRTSYRLA